MEKAVLGVWAGLVGVGVSGGWRVWLQCDMGAAYDAYWAGSGQGLVVWAGSRAVWAWPRSEGGAWLEWAGPRYMGGVIMYAGLGLGRV